MTALEEQSHEALATRAAERDLGAFAELYGRLAPGLLGMALRILPDHAAAAGIVEQAFVLFWNETRRFPRDGASVAAWLSLTARQIAVNTRRSRLRLPAVSGSKTSPLGDYAWLPHPEEIARIEERRELLRKVLHQLPKDQRDALELVVFEGLTEEELAARLGEPLGRVRSGLRASMRFLRHRLRAVLGTWSANI
ncbi:MAG: sigma-70 family RNA polymerase sigma factor [Acidobacteriia bacterium]|nr:sigma-70 family RNA polymerase sigma factor [Terriglobia bacterium]